jgi:putative addiction module component (TIGR02574 family)
MATIDDLLNQALQLTAEERTRLAHELLLSVDGEPAVEADAEQEWDLEIARRARGVLDGTTQTVSWSDLKARLAARQPRTR